MSYNDQEKEQMIMDNADNGDTWYFDEFGEYRNSADDTLTEASLQQETIVPDELDETTATNRHEISSNLHADEDFNETLQSEHIGDQLNDPQLQDEAEADYHNHDKSLGEKIKDKFNHLKGN